MAMATHVNRTRELLTRMNIHSDVAERYLSHCRRRKDLFGFIDIVGITDEQTIGVQATSDGARKDHITKLTEECGEEVRRWLKCPSRAVWLVTWKKKKRPNKRGVKCLMWCASVYIITVNDSGFTLHQELVE
jgi:hypothetical protein